MRLSASRKLVHMALALVPALGWWVSYELALILTALISAGSLAVEVARWRWPVLNNLLWHLLPTIFRPWEGHRILGSTWFAIGALASYLLLGRDVGGTAFLFLAWGDPAAELVGRALGRPGAGKTLVGSLGCLLACLVAGWVGVRLGGLAVWTAVIGAVVATLVERWPPPPDDNVWMPLLAGLSMAAVGFLL